MPISRRTVLAAPAAVAAAGGQIGAIALPMPRAHDASWLRAVLERHAAFGGKASGGPGDEAWGPG